MTEYIKLSDDATFYWHKEGEPLELMPSMAAVYERGLYPVRTVTKAELEALRYPGSDEEE